MQNFDYLYCIPIYPPNFAKEDRANFRYHFWFLKNYPHLKNKRIHIVCSLRWGPNSQDQHTGQSDQDWAWQQEWIKTKSDPAKEAEGFIRECFAQFELPSAITIEFSRHPNYGGTVAALWDTYQLLKNQITADYVICTEDDWLHPDWGTREWLLDNGIICVGMNSRCDEDKFGYKVLKHTYFQSPYEAQIYAARFASKGFRMMDGGLYFLKWSSLKLIEERIGPFSKASKDQPYDHSLHGILYGEVGFPAELWMAGFRFCGLTDLSIPIKQITQLGEEFFEWKASRETMLKKLIEQPWN